MAQSHLSEVDRVLERVPETAQEFAGFASNPAPLLVAQYERIAREEMQALPFYHASMPIVAECVHCLKVSGSAACSPPGC